MDRAIAHRRPGRDEAMEEGLGGDRRWAFEMIGFGIGEQGCQQGARFADRNLGHLEQQMMRETVAKAPHRARQMIGQQAADPLHHAIAEPCLQEGQAVDPGLDGEQGG